jgi:hypothetical protein
MLSLTALKTTVLLKIQEKLPKARLQAGSSKKNPANNQQLILHGILIYSKLKNPPPLIRLFMEGDLRTKVKTMWRFRQRGSL